jgi:hypothetical protein
VIEEYKNINRTQGTRIEQINTEKNRENQSNLRHQRSIPTDYTITNTSWRVLRLILGNAGLSNFWWGIVK